MAKKHKHPEHENLERWLVSYSDFITLLFATFVVLYALGLPGKSNFSASSINPYSNNLYILESDATPRTASISALVIFGLYAIIERVSKAAEERLGFARLSNRGYKYS